MMKKFILLAFYSVWSATYGLLRLTFHDAYSHLATLTGGKSVETQLMKLFLAPSLNMRYFFSVPSHDNLLLYHPTGFPQYYNNTEYIVCACMSDV